MTARKSPDARALASERRVADRERTVTRHAQRADKRMVAEVFA